MIDTMIVAEVDMDRMGEMTHTDTVATTGDRMIVAMTVDIARIAVDTTAAMSVVMTGHKSVDTVMSAPMIAASEMTAMAASTDMEVVMTGTGTVPEVVVGTTAVQLVATTGNDMTARVNARAPVLETLPLVQLATGTPPLVEMEERTSRMFNPSSRNKVCFSSHSCCILSTPLMQRAKCRETAARLNHAEPQFNYAGS